LAKQAMTILNELKPHTRNSEFVFPNPLSIHRPLSDNAVLAGLRRMGIEKTEMSGHGWRAQCAIRMGGPTTARRTLKNGSR
jgi:integrase